MDYLSVYFQIVRKHKAWEATAYLLEKAGDIQGAFRILLEVNMLGLFISY